jgi:hypothetical protein
MARARTHVVLAGPDLARLVEISAKLDPMDYAPVIAHTRTPLAYFAGTFNDRPEGCIAELRATDNVAEVKEALDGNPQASFVFLIEEMPPSAALAHVAGRQAVFLARAEPAVTISATLVALLYQRYLDARQA